VEVNARVTTGAGKESGDRSKAVFALLEHMGRQARQDVVVARKRGASCIGLMERLGACAERRTAAVAGKVALGMGKSRELKPKV
jgi:hypothetical protein